MNKQNNKKIFPKRNQRVFIAMSGGVDSSVAALLLKKQGYDVTGVFMKYWMDSSSGAGNENRCCSLEARYDAQRVCAQLDMPFLTWDFQKEFKKAVVDEFIEQYKMGMTPNPCVTCNKEIKLGLFIEKALKEGADFVATGHYTKILLKQNFGERKANPSASWRTGGEKRKKEYRLYQAKDKKKDQSYFLYNLTQKQLARILFPLGDLTKDEVRKIAQKAGLPVALKKDSQEVCFVKDNDLKKFLSAKIKIKKGDIVLFDGSKIGEHQGAQFYTIGQRAPVGGTGPYFVISKDINKNRLIVANPAHNLQRTLRKNKNSQVMCGVKGANKELFIKEILVKNVNWVSGKEPKLPFECRIKTRYQQKAQKAVIKKLQTPIRQLADKLQILFSKPQRGVAPGQSAVFYSGEEIIGGGIIK